MRRLRRFLVGLSLLLLLIMGWHYAPWLKVKFGFAPSALQTVLGKMPEGGFSPAQLVQNARDQIGVTVRYDPEYTVIPYPNGDVAQFKGVCTDVVIRAMRGQGVDLQKLVHEDMRQNFSHYPTRWGLNRADANIDHRRVLNLEVFMARRGLSLPLSTRPADFQAGDWVTWRVGDKNLPHIGIVSDKKSRDGVPLIIHNIGLGTQEEDVLFSYKMVGHYRW
ncbi:DUF1287 domain-containing protein [Hydromonas duriensis]|uniref:DUF1287 domain-containing protein n=1 Tax=Hydromonas duriensis TaxID=1527608 RepID=A0A4R6YB72_9BURK|nr:DUF1287 domain-containing protein [Hydromonas duriensis]TDR32839.1 hypothetical protein DFR44_102138 [Hydromonas duriensis]